MKVVNVFVSILFILWAILSIQSLCVIEEKNSFHNAGNDFCYSFSIPYEMKRMTKPDFSSLLVEILAKYDANLFRTTTVYHSDNEYEIITYCILNRETGVFDKIGLDQGSWISKESKEMEFVSSIRTGSRFQIGLIKKLPSNASFRVEKLLHSNSQLENYGKYMIEIDPDKRQSFFFDLVKSINMATQHPISIEDLGIVEPFLAYPQRVSLFTFFPMALLPILLTTLLYSVMISRKKISSFFLEGYSLIKIFNEIGGSIVGVLAVAGVPIASLAALIILPASEYAWMPTIMAIAYSSTVGVAYIAVQVMYHRLSLTHSIKNKNGLAPIFVGYTVLKIIAIGLAFVYCGNSIEMIRQNLELKATMNTWSSFQDWAVFPLLKVGYDEDELYQQINKNDHAIAQGLYPYLNKQGALYCDLYRQIRATPILVVNPNYLKLFPVYDTKGNAVSIAENDTDMIILSSASTSETSNVITDLVKYREHLLELESTFYPTTINKGSNVRVIPIKKDQRMFTFILGEEYYTPSFIKVITESNSITTERVGIRGSGLNDPLKVKLHRGDAVKTYNTIYQKLTDLSLDDNLTELTSLPLYIEDMRKNNELVIYINTICMSILFFFLIAFDIQLLALYFVLNKKKIVIQYIYGYHGFQRYSLFIGISIIQLLLTLLVVFKSSLLVGLGLTVLTVLENLIALSIMIRKEKRLLLVYLKGA